MSPAESIVMRPHSPVRHGSPPHPLAVQLAARLPAGARILELGCGSGRNRDALLRYGFAVTATSDGTEARDLAQMPDRAFDAALSTHALLHGTPSRIASLLALVAERLHSGAPLFATFGSTMDSRFGRGMRIDDVTWAPDEGEEAGVAHAYFAECVLRAMLASWFAIESLEEVRVDAIAGRWAHAKPSPGRVHWFVRALRQ